MKSQLTLIISMLTLALQALASPAHKPPSSSSLEVKNLADFAQLYGYVRFFHPSDEAQQIEWTRFVVHGVSKVRSLKTKEALKETLEQLFSPVAPSAQFFASAQAPAPSGSPKPCPPDRLMSWQHLGLRLFEHSRYTHEMPYESKRLNSADTPEAKRPLFDLQVEPNEVLDVTLRQGLSARIPLTACRGARPVQLSDDLLKLKEALKKLKDTGLTTDSKDVQIANVIITWAELQHFYPYFDDLKVNWERQLERSLVEVINDQNTAEYYDTMRQLVALIEDSHGYIRPSPVKHGYLPIRVAEFDGEVVVIGTESPLFKLGDVIEQVGQERTQEHLSRLETYISASPHLRSRRALNGFGEGLFGEPVTVVLRRGEERLTLKAKRDHASGHSEVFNTINQFDFPPYKELAPGLIYINGVSISHDTFQARLPEIAKAKGVIFDYRWDGKMREGFGSLFLLQIVDHLALPKGYSIPAEPYQIPQVIRPDRKRLTFRKGSGPVPSSLQKIEGEVVIITDHALMSSYESGLALIKHFKLATTVGERTGGCNGNMNLIFLADGSSVSYTGMKVTRFDGSQLNLKGIEPDVPVQPSRAGLIAGEDEVLAKAVQVLRDKVKRAQLQP